MIIGRNGVLHVTAANAAVPTGALPAIVAAARVAPLATAVRAVLH